MMPCCCCGASAKLWIQQRCRLLAEEIKAEIEMILDVLVHCKERIVIEFS
jgi:hypothetical protein